MNQNEKKGRGKKYGTDTGHHTSGPNKGVRWVGVKANLGQGIGLARGE